MSGHADAIEALHKSDGDVLQVNKKKESPLMISAQNGHIDVIHRIAKLHPHVDKEFALFIMEVNQFMNQNGISKKKMEKMNETLNLVLSDDKKSSSEKIDDFMNNRTLMSSLNEHQGFFRKWFQNKFNKALKDTHSVRQFKAFKEKYTATIPVKAEIAEKLSESNMQPPPNTAQSAQQASSVPAPTPADQLAVKVK